MPPVPLQLSASQLPVALRELSPPVECLYLCGRWPRCPAVAVVGTRRPTPQAVGFTLDLCRALGQAGVLVVSGGARGIDTAAHQGALQAGAPTLVVAPAGWEVAYPEENRELFHQVVAQGGGYVSHLADDTTATRAAFFRRNELMAAVVQAVVLVEAPLRSGARNAVAAARRLGKQVFVVPSPPWSEPGRSAAVELLRGGTPLSGPKQLLRWLQRTAQLELVLDDAAGVERELTEALPVEPTPDVRAPVPTGRLPPRTDAELALLVARARQAAGAAGVALVQWLSLGDQTLAGAAAELGLPASRLSCLVTELELAGVLRRRTPEELELLGD